MNTADALVKSIFQRERLDDCSLEELQSIAGQYPYFAPIQLLLAEKLRSGDEELYNEQLKKLSIRFNNPLWLDFLLDGYKTEPMSMPENGSTTSMAAPNSGDVQMAEFPDKEEASGPEVEISVLPLEDNGKSVDEPETSNVNPIEVDKVPGSGEVYSEQTKIGREIEASPAINDVPVNEDSPVLENTVVDDEEEEIGTHSQAAGVDTNPSIAQNPEQKIEEAPLSMPLSELTGDAGKNDITFEPYHTVDYFASQGIKFVPEEKPADRFGQQLKSFTEWLKAMKRLSQTEIIKVSDSQSEEKVQQLASHSVTEAEVSTEAMAEVWLKQGNKEKAIEIYSKLSLLNPAKSAYFASLAEQLKDR